MRVSISLSRDPVGLLQLRGVWYLSHRLLFSFDICFIFFGRFISMLRYSNSFLVQVERIRGDGFRQIELVLRTRSI